MSDQSGDLWAENSADAAAGERLIADRLSATQAERVIARALELEAEDLDQPHLFSGEQLERIAGEINMDASFVRQALAEVQLAPDERTLLDQRILQYNIVEIETIAGLSREDLEAMAMSWMQDYEGLIANAPIDGGIAWDIDRRIMSRLRASLFAGGNRISRVAGGDVDHRVHSVSETEHLVALHSRGRGPLLLAKSAFALAAAVLVFGLFGALGELDSGFVNFARIAAGALVGAAAVAGAGVLGARRWALGISRALRRSLTGLAEKAKPKKQRRSFRLPWKRREPS